MLKGAIDGSTLKHLVAACWLHDSLERVEASLLRPSRNSRKLAARIKRIRGQVEAIELSLTHEDDCGVCARHRSFVQIIPIVA
jgi:hypothetical protein